MNYTEHFRECPKFKRFCAQAQKNLHSLQSKGCYLSTVDPNEITAWCLGRK